MASHIKSSVENAIRQQNQSGGLPLIDYLQKPANDRPSYWIDIAGELQQRGLYLDAIDCWESAIEASKFDERKSVMVDMAKNLWDAGSKTDDLFLIDKALQTYESTDSWEEVAHSLVFLGRDKSEILDAISNALRLNGTLDESILIDGLEIENYLSLAYYYIANNDLPNALQYYSELAFETDDEGSLQFLIEGIIIYLLENGLFHIARDAVKSIIEPDETPIVDEAIKYIIDTRPSEQTSCSDFYVDEAGNASDDQPSVMGASDFDMAELKRNIYLLIRKAETQA